MMIISEKLELFMFTKRIYRLKHYALKKDSVDFFKHRENVAKLLLNFKKL